ncbi:MAG: ribosome silencing factor [Desulfobacterales bacterium]|nr:ribosome silencing factor [Desulfobacterales bacterium]
MKQENPNINDESSFKGLIDPYINAILTKKAKNIVALNVREFCSYTDGIIMCTGTSTRQVIAIGEQIEYYLKQKGTRPLSIEGLKDGRWVLMDYGEVIIHVFYEEIRDFYDLEGLWIDVPRIDF